MSLQPIIARVLIITLLSLGLVFTATTIAVSLFPHEASAQCCGGGPCGACDVCALFGCYFQGFYESYYQGYYEGYYQSYYEGYYQSYYEGYYQGYYQSYYEGYYQSYYEGYYQSYYEGAYGPTEPDLVGTYLSPSSGSAGSITLQGRATNSGVSASGPFTSYFEVQGNGTLTWTSPAISVAAGSQATVTAGRTFSQGSYQVRLCVDGGGTVTESNEGNNCSAWAPLTVSAVANPTASLTANPLTVTSGGQSTLTWSSTNATSCSGAGFSTGAGSPTSGSVAVTPTPPSSTYILTCTNGTTNATDSETVSVSGGACSGAGPIDITATPNRIEAGSGTPVTISWTGSNVASCTVTNENTGGVVKTSTAAACSVSDNSVQTSLNAQTRYRLTCGSLTKDVVVNIVPRFEEF